MANDHFALPHPSSPYRLEILAEMAGKVHLKIPICGNSREYTKNVSQKLTSLSGRQRERKCREARV